MNANKGLFEPVLPSSRSELKRLRARKTSCRGALGKKGKRKKKQKKMK